MSKSMFSQEDIEAIQSKQRASKAYADNRTQEILNQMDFTARLFVKFAQEFPSVARQVGFETRRYMYGKYNSKQMSGPMYQIYGDLSENNLNVYVTTDGKLLCGRVEYSNHWDVDIHGYPKEGYALKRVNADEFVSLKVHEIASNEESRVYILQKTDGSNGHM